MSETLETGVWRKVDLNSQPLFSSGRRQLIVRFVVSESKSNIRYLAQYLAGDVEPITRCPAVVRGARPRYGDRMRPDRGGEFSRFGTDLRIGEGAAEIVEL